MWFRMSGLNQRAATVSWYSPVGTRGIRNSPSGPEVVSIVRPVAKSFACSVAPGITAPVGSMTVPLIAPSTAVWASAPGGCARYKLNNK